VKKTKKTQKPEKNGELGGNPNAGAMSASARARLLALNAGDSSGSSDEGAAPPARGCAGPLARARASRRAGAAFSLAAIGGFAALLYAHAFAAPRGAAFATCASTLADGPCARAAGGGDCLLRCPPRCGDFWVSPVAYAVYGANNSYRGDSKLCRAAMHAGALGRGGGCARARVGGAAAAFGGGPGAAGVTSRAAPYGPASLSFAPRAPDDAGICADLGAALGAWVLGASALGWALAGGRALPLGAAWAGTLAGAYLYLVFTARGAEPVGAAADAAGGALALAAAAAAAWPALARGPLRAARARAPAAAWAALALPLAAGAHLNLATALLPDVDLDAASLRAGGAPAAALVAAVAAAGVAGAALAARELVRARACARAARAYGAVLAVVGAASAALAARGAALHVHHALLAAALLPLAAASPALPAVAAQGLLAGVLLNGVAFWGVQGPWDAPPPARAPPPPCAPVAAAAGAAGALSRVAVDWACSAPPSATAVLLANGARVFAGAPPAALAVPPASNLTLALVFEFADGALSAESAAAAFSA